MAAKKDTDSQAVELTQKILGTAITGAGKFKSASTVAEEAIEAHKDPDLAIARLVSTHRRIVGASGFASGVGGLATMAVTIPADITLFYAYAARMSATIAHIRGYDLTSDEVRSGVLISLLGAGAGAAIGKVGADIGQKVAIAQLGRLPGAVLISINKAVGFRLITKFGTKGAINLVKIVPMVGGGVGAGVNVVTINGIYKYSDSLFVPLKGTDATPDTEQTSRHPTGSAPADFVDKS